MLHAQIKASHLQHSFAPDTLLLGKTLQQAQHVYELEYSAHISARVEDPEQGLCQTFISIQADGPELTIDGECSCELEINCAHVVATLLQLIENRDLSNTDRGTTTTDKQALSAQTSPHQKSFNWKAEETTKQLHYMLSLEGEHLHLSIKLLSDNTSQTFNIPLSLNNPPRFIQQTDLELFNLLGTECQQLNEKYRLPTNNPALLDQLLTTERCHWADTGQAVLTQHQPLPGNWAWHQDIDGRQKLLIETDDKTLQTLPCLPPRYLDKKNKHIGLIESGLSASQDQQLFSLPAYAPDKIKQAAQCSPLKEILSLESQSLLKPKLASKSETRRCTAITHFSLTIAQQPVNNKHKCFWASSMSLDGKLEFAYPGRRIAPSEPSDFIGQFTNGLFIHWQRDQATETVALATLQQQEWYTTSITENDNWKNPKQNNNGLSFAHALAFDLNLFRQLGWQLQLPANLPPVIQADKLKWHAKLIPQASNRHMLFSLHVIYNNQSVNLIQALHISLQQQWIDLAELINEQQSCLASIKQMIIIVDNQRLKPLLNQLLELTSPRALNKDGNLYLSRARKLAIEKLCQSQKISLHVSSEIEPHLVQIQSSEQSSPTNAKLNAELRPYQQQGVDWLYSLFKNQLGGLLADDMGLGKTLQVLAFLLRCKQQNQLTRPCLILAPTSLLSNWKVEAEKFTPDLTLLVLHGPNRHQHFSRLVDFDIVITSYPLLVRDAEQLLITEWQVLILDEAQAIKTPTSKVSRAVREFNTDSNFCLSGTPLENHLGELWSLFDFTLPGLLGSQAQFNDWFRDPIEKHDNEHQYTLLIERLQAFMLRRNKRDVLPQLPNKTHQSCLIEMTEEQQHIYTGIELQMKQNLQQQIRSRGLQGSRMHILEALTRLRQICCDPRLLHDSTAINEKNSAKLSTLMEMLEEMLPQGRKVLLFSQFTSMLKLIQQALEKRNIDYALLSGQTRNRDQQIQRFQQGKVDLFLISLKAGGSGLNLTQADTVIHYDPWWNPAAENQATDRAHRIGQHKSVMVYKLIAENSIEQKILQLQQRKQALADTLLNSSSPDEAFDTTDLNNLLQLLDFNNE